MIADEASDISHNEHMCISSWWVSSHYEINEDSLGHVQLPDTKAEILFSVLNRALYFHCFAHSLNLCVQEVDVIGIHWILHMS